MIESLHFSALPSQWSVSLIFAHLLCLLVLAEVPVWLWPVIFSHSAIEGVISLTLLSDSAVAVSASDPSAEADQSASLATSDAS